MNALVTGGGGYVGSGLLLKLLKEFPDSTVTSLDNMSRGNYDYADRLRETKQVRLLVGDIRSRADVQKAVTKDIKAIIHLAALPGIGLCKEQPENAITTNVYGTYLLLQEAVKRGVEKFVFLSSAAVYGVPTQQPITEDHPLKPISLYGVTKEAAEKLVNLHHTNHGLATTVLRLSNAYGLSGYTRWETVIPKFAWQAANGQPLTVRGTGNQQRNFVHVDDVGKAVIHCLKAPENDVVGRTFNVGGENFTVNEIASIITEEAKRVLGKKVATAHVPSESGEVDTPRFDYNYGEASRRIGFKPQRGVQESVAELLEHALATET